MLELHISNNWQVPSKLVTDGNEFAATWVPSGELPPDYSECDPLQSDIEPDGPRVFEFGSFSSESTGSFWDEDDDVSEVAETGPNWSGGLLYRNNHCCVFPSNRRDIGSF